MKREGKQKASSLSVASEWAVEWSNSEVGDEPSAMETAPIVHGGAAEDFGDDDEYVFFPFVFSSLPCLEFQWSRLQYQQCYAAVMPGFAFDGNI